MYSCQIELSEIMNIFLNSISNKQFMCSIDMTVIIVISQLKKDVILTIIAFNYHLKLH